MKITITFDTLEEFQAHMRIQTPNKPLQEAPRGTESKKDQEAARSDLIEDTPAPGAPTVPEVTEDFRVEVRKALAELNKKVGKNIASDLIKGFGVDKLTDVALADLPALMEQAKEALNAE